MSGAVASAFQGRDSPSIRLPFEGKWREAVLFDGLGACCLRRYLGTLDAPPGDYVTFKTLWFPLIGEGSYASREQLSKGVGLLALGTPCSFPSPSHLAHCPDSPELIPWPPSHGCVHFIANPSPPEAVVAGRASQHLSSQVEGRTQPSPLGHFEALDTWLFPFLKLGLLLALLVLPSLDFSTVLFSIWFTSSLMPSKCGSCKKWIPNI